VGNIVGGLVSGILTREGRELGGAAGGINIEISCFRDKGLGEKENDSEEESAQDVSDEEVRLLFQSSDLPYEIPPL
jgi:hypothetical protein